MPPPTNAFADLLLGQAGREPGRRLLWGPDGTTWTYGDLDATSARLAHALAARDVRPGDRISVQLPKSAGLLALHVACARVGAVWCPLNTAYTDREVDDLVADADPVLVVRERPVRGVTTVALAALQAEAESLSPAYDDVPRSAGDPAVMLYTSGTTGRPKGAVLSAGNLCFGARNLATAWGFSRDDVVLHVLPLHHAHGLFVAVHVTLAAGGALRFHEAFEPGRVLADLPACTVFMGVPTHYTRLLSHPGLDRTAAERVRLFTCGSAPLLAATHEAFRERTGAAILERYGMTETHMIASNPLHGQRRPGTVGPPLPGVQVRIVAGPAGDSASDGSPGAAGVAVHDRGVADDSSSGATAPGAGEPGGIEVSGPNVFGGYWRRPELQATEFTPDGWFVTGDVGRFDADGYLEIVGRAKDLVISGGLNVYPKEVEQALDALPGVLESAVVGVADPDFGEAVVAAVVAEPGAGLDPEELRRLLRADLAGFKIPKRVYVVEALPRNTMGKVRKDVLRDQLA
ncbi:MAG: malonyl-CoA synthase [Actinomycetota bacterium]|nr:MAG: malonyl-CoA synthase [Actinomycetota bacterium]